MPATDRYHSTIPAAGASREERRRTFKSGRISYAKGSITVDCLVRDVSPHGAKIRLQSDLPVPDRFSLYVHSDGLKVSCAVRWRSGDTVGVEFESEPKKVATKTAQVVCESIRRTSGPSA